MEKELTTKQKRQIELRTCAVCGEHLAKGIMVAELSSDEKKGFIFCQKCANTAKAVELLSGK